MNCIISYIRVPEVISQKTTRKNGLNSFHLYHFYHSMIKQSAIQALQNLKVNRIGRLRNRTGYPARSIL